MIATLVALVVTAGLLILGWWRQRFVAVRWGIVAGRLAFILATGALGLLTWALLTDQFALIYVANNSRQFMAWPYKIGAVWAGQAGSLLLWLWMLTLMLTLVSLRSRAGAEDGRGLVVPALATLSVLAIFFALLITLVENPFAVRLPAPADGRGMNPLLQNPSMLVHPLLVYLGFVGFSVPFAFAVAALVTRRTDAGWLRRTRGWSLGAWLLLTTGIVVGGQWAYVELGWGGYWAWDPVENASLLPWLTATAFIHSALVQERRGLLKAWNLGLIMATFALTILGTFLTRSGLLSSVHAFAESPIGPWFLTLLGAVVAVSLYLLLDRLRALARAPRIESNLSREAAFLLNNLLMLTAAFAVLWGTLFPLLSRVWGTEFTIGAPFFNRVVGPIFLAIVALMGIGPILAWRRTDPRGVGRQLLWPGAAALAGAQIMLVAGIRQPLALFGFTLVLFVGALTVAEVLRSVAARKAATGETHLRATFGLFATNPRRYGGYVVHIGILIMTVGILGSSIYDTTIRTPLRLGEVAAVGPYHLRYLGLERTVERGLPTAYANLAVQVDDEVVAYVRPGKQIHPGFVDVLGPTTEIAIVGSLQRDLYVVMAGFDEAGTVAGFEFSVKPLVAWVWIGGYVVLAGTAFSLWPRRRRTFSGLVEPLLEDLNDLENDLRLGKLDQAAYTRLRQQLGADLAARLARERALEAMFAERVARLIAGDSEPELERTPPAAAGGGTV